MQGLGLGRSLCQRTGTERKLSAFLPLGDDDAFSILPTFPFFGFQLFLVFLLAVFDDGTPSLFLDEFSFENELHPLTDGNNRADILHATGGEGFKHTSGYHVVDDYLLSEHVYRLLACDEQGVVVGHFLAVHRMRIEFGQLAGMNPPDRMVVQKGNQGGNFGKDIFGNMSAARAWVGNVCLFVEFLSQGNGLFCRVSVSAVRFFLQGGQVIQKRWLLSGFLAHNRFYSGIRSLFEFIIQGSGFCLVEPTVGRGETETLITLLYGKAELPERLWLELLVLQETGADHTEGRGLYPAQRVSASSCCNRYGLGGIDAHQPVGFAAGTGGIIEIVIRRSALQMGKSLFDGFVRE